MKESTAVESIYITHPFVIEHYVYRVYAEDETLIYIGSTNNVATRISDHAGNADWFHLAHRVDIETHATRSGARAAEKAAVLAERPLGNVKWTCRDRGNRKRVPLPRPPQPA